MTPAVGQLDDPAWTEGFHFGEDEIEVTVRYRPDTWPDAVAFLAGVTSLGGEVLDVAELDADRGEGRGPT